jgi:hypothetical protein
MKTNQKPRFTSKELAEQINKHIQELAEATDVARVSTEITRYLETCARFHQYSHRNIWLIMMKCPDASQVAGLRTWNRLGRKVKRGEKGIPILAPVVVKNDEFSDQEEKVVGYRVVFVFDVSQTVGDPLPEEPDWKSPEKNKELADRLIAFAREHGISVTEKKLQGDVQGVSKGGAIEIDLEAGTSALIHEIGHELLHRGEDRPRWQTIRELEAESVAFVVAKHYGLESAGSPNYVALHGASSELIFSHMERIQKTAAMIIEALENK